MGEVMNMEGNKLNNERRERGFKEEFVSYDDSTKTIIIDCRKSIYPASIEDEEIWMSTAIDLLMEYTEATSIILRQSRDFVYDYEQTEMLKEIAFLIKKFIKVKRILSPRKVSPGQREGEIKVRLGFLQKILLSEIRRDPVGAYLKLEREIVRLESIAKVSKDKGEKESINYYLANALLPIKEELKDTKLIKPLLPKLVGYKEGDRSIYREVFHPIIKPNFMLTKYMLLPPRNSDKIKTYKIGKTEVNIYRLKDKAMYYYQIIPPEFVLSEKLYTVLDVARTYLSEHKPSSSEFSMPERMREVFYNIGRDLVIEIANNMNYVLKEEEIEELANILVRYSAGYGIIELLLEDENIQDFYVNAPVGINPIYITHAEYGECETNLIPTLEDVEAWATRFRIESGRPLDESSPILDTEIAVKNSRARVAAITRTLSPDGLAFAFRRHRDKPWTFPLFIKYRMLNPLAAGLLSFIIDGARTMLYAGTRGTGKTSLLSATITEIMRKYRIVTVEDTLELPIENFVKLGYNVERLKARSALSMVENEIPADEAIRTSLRLGDSCLIIGEVRSTEAKALYESMRIGALANVVAGTIHGDSPYGVFDRVVNDLGVPRTSFKATDVVIIANRLRSADGMQTYRRVVEITEVLKEWEEDPIKEKGFVKLMEYNAKKDTLEPTSTFLEGESYILNEISKRVKEWHNNWDAVWENIQLRAKMKQRMVELSTSLEIPSLLEAESVVEANDKFHVFTAQVLDEYGEIDNKRIYALWDEWLKNVIKRRYGKYI